MADSHVEDREGLCDPVSGRYVVVLPKGNIVRPTAILAAQSLSSAYPSIALTAECIGVHDKSGPAVGVRAAHVGALEPCCAACGDPEDREDGGRDRGRPKGEAMGEVAPEGRIPELQGN